MNAEKRAKERRTKVENQGLQEGSEGEGLPGRSRLDFFELI